MRFPPLTRTERDRLLFFATGVAVVCDLCLLFGSGSVAQAGAVAGIVGLAPAFIFGVLSTSDAWPAMLITLLLGTAVNTLAYYYLFKLLWLLTKDLRHGHAD